MSTNTPLRIWFNRTFATSYWLLNLIRNNPDHRPVKLYATHVDPDSPVLSAADHSEQEPTITGDDYITWALNFCKTHNIHVFLPTAQVQLVSANSDRFEKAGVRIIASPPALIELFGNKRLAYESLTKQGFNIPPYRTANSPSSIEHAYNDLLHQLGNPTADVVIKPTVGVGAQGFRIITQRGYSLDDLLATNDPHTSLDRVISAYRHTVTDQPLPEIMLMPFLAAPEISVDTLTSPTGQPVQRIARVKENPRRTRFMDPTPELDAYMTDLLRAYPLAYLTNTQFRWWENKLVLLEVNTRPSGGLHAVRETGLNLPWAAVKLAIGETPQLDTPHLGSGYTIVDHPVILQT